MKQRLQALVQHFDALSQRDRLTLAAGFVALLLGVEALLVAPLHDKRRMIEQASAAEAASQTEAQAVARQQLEAQLAELQARGARLDEQLAALGLQRTPSRSPAGFIAAALQGAGVTLVSMRGLPVQELQATPPADAAAEAAATAVAEPAPQGATFYRHRAEIRLQGPVAELARAVQVLESGATAMRVEDVRVAPGDKGQPLQATVVLTTINQERTWFAL
jgi:hypothetical protein